MKERKVGICGHFGIGKKLVNGQTIKTVNFTNELEKRLGKDNIKKVDTHNAQCHMLKLIKESLDLLKECGKIVFFPSSRGLLFFVPFFFWLNKIYKRDLYYMVIGGWLSEYLRRHKLIKLYLRSLDGIFVETNIMKTGLEKMGFKNVRVLANFKKMTCINESEIRKDFVEPYKVCIFSRIEEKKGIEDAIKVIIKVNQFYNKEVYALDIYGPIQTGYQERFEELCLRFPEYINYCGIIEAKEAAKIIKNYYFLLFPTRYYTEGIPGTIIDAYSAGVPVVCSKWESFEDIVIESETGYGYVFGDLEDMYNVMRYVYNNKDKCITMRSRCILEAGKYRPEIIMNRFEKELEAK